MWNFSETLKQLFDTLRDLVPFVQFKYVKNIHGGVLLLVLKVTLLHGCFSRFLKCTNGTELPKTSHVCKFVFLFVST